MDDDDDEEDPLAHIGPAGGRRPAALAPPYRAAPALDVGRVRSPVTPPTPAAYPPPILETAARLPTFAEEEGAPPPELEGQRDSEDDDWLTPDPDDDQPLDGGDLTPDGNDDYARPEMPAFPPPKTHRKKADPRDAAAAAAVAREPPTPRAIDARVLGDAEIRTLTSKNARAACAERGLMVGGNRTTLLGRLLTAEDGRREAEEAPPRGPFVAPPKRRRAGSLEEEASPPGALASALGVSASAGDPYAVSHCPVCGRWLRGDVYTCAVGHLACGSCKAGLAGDLCPEPSCSLVMGARRALHVQKRLANRPMPCAFDGCPFEGTKAERTAHGPTCFHRKFRCPFSEKCADYLKLEDLREHGIDAHRLRIAVKWPGERFTDYIVEMKDWDDRQRRSRKWKLLYTVETDIYLLVVRRKRDPELRHMSYAIAAHRIFRQNNDDAEDLPRQIRIAIALEQRQAIAVTLSPEDALTTRKPCQPIPLDRLMDRPMYNSITFPAHWGNLTMGEDEDTALKIDLRIEFSVDRAG